MRNILYLSILFLASCQALHRAIPKGQRNRIVLLETNQPKEEKNLRLDQNSVTNETEVNANEYVLLKPEGEQIAVNEDEFAVKQSSNETSQVEEFQKQLDDTLFVDQTELDRGYRIAKNQKTINVVLILTLFGFFLATVFLIWGIINIWMGNQLPYVTQEVDAQLRERKRNYFIILGIKLVLLLILIALILLL